MSRMSQMKIALIALIFPALTQAAALEVKAKTDVAPAPLTTDQVWTADPSASNPARAFYALHRVVTLEGLKTEMLTQGGFGISADSILSATTINLRSRAFYRLPTECPCSAREVPAWFETYTGASEAAASAAAAWEAELRAESPRLTAWVHEFHAPTEDRAKQGAQILFDNWLKQTTASWEKKSVEGARRAARAAEVREAVDAGACVRKGSSLANGQAHTDSKVTGWEGAMEPAPAEPGKPYPLPIARSPARRWDGAFSIRGLLEAAGSKKLDGQFLLDSATPETVVSPEWLRNQGILPPVIEVEGSKPSHARFTGSEALVSDDELAHHGQIASFTVGGLALPITDVLLHDTELYAPPENVSVCCSGVLGTDFLAKFVLQFRPDLPLEVVVWPKENFHPVWTEMKDPVWIEASVTPEGAIVSSCDVRSADGRTKYANVLWDVAAPIALEAHAPWGTAAGKSLNVVCDHAGATLATGVLVQTHMESSPFAGVKDPAMTVGIPLLTRGEFIFDLPHGRIWFPRAALATPVRQNRTGLSLAYDFLGEERILKVISVRGGHGSPAATLVASGLRAGSLITEVDGKPASDLDLWEVEQRLAGARGPEVKLSWTSPHAKASEEPSHGTITVPK